MNVLMWLRFALGALVRVHISLLESGSVGAQGRLPSPARFDTQARRSLEFPGGCLSRRARAGGDALPCG